VTDAPRARRWASRSITGRTAIGWPGPLLERIASAAPSPQASTGSSGGWVQAFEPTASGSDASRRAPPTPWPPQADPIRSGDTLVVELDSDSATEQLLPAMPCGNESSTTRPEVRTRPRAYEHRPPRVLSWYWAVPIGLTLAMVMAMTGAWWLLDRGDAATRAGAEREASEPLEATTFEPLAAAASVRAKSRPTHDGAHQRQRASEGPREAIEPTPPTAAPPHPTDRVRPAPPKPKRRAKPPAKSVPKVLLKVRGSVELSGAQVRVGSRISTVGDFRDVLVPAGHKALEWRAHEHDAWRPGGSWKLEPGTTVMAFVTADGLEVRTLP
jgi:hypothetical protein